MKKFRPVLSAHQIATIIALAKQEFIKSSSADARSILQTLSPFAAKIENYAIFPAYVATPAPTKIDELGFNEPTANQLTPAQKRESLYNQFMQSGANHENLSLSELETINLYRYENDLMSPEEEAEYEAKQINL